MVSEIIVAVCSLLGTAAGSFGGMRLMSYRIEQLERRVDKHNSIIERTFVLEEKMKEAERRLNDIEDK